MISKVQFQDISNSFNVDAEYNSIYNFDYGTIETSSEIGMLSQEARSVKFKLILDSFLETLVFETGLLLSYRIVVYDSIGQTEFIGFLKEDGSLTIDYEEQIITIEAVDIFYFIGEAGEVANEKKLSIPNKMIIPAAIISGLKNRLPLAATGSARGFKIWTYSDRYFIDKGLRVISNEFTPKYSWWSVNGDWEMEHIWQRVKVADASGNEYYYTEQYEGFYSYPFITADKDKEMVSELIVYDYDGWTGDDFRLWWIDKGNRINVDVMPNHFARDPNATLDWFDGYYCYFYDHEPDKPILGCTLEMQTTYEPIGEASLFSTSNSEFWFCDYKSANIENFAYWMNVTNRPHQCRIYVNKADASFQRYDNITDDNEVMFQVENRTKDVQMAVFYDFAVKDDGLQTRYVEIYLHYLVKAWGIGSSYSDISELDEDHKRSCYGYRKRTLKFRGYQLLDDNWNTSKYGYAEMPPMVYVTGSWEYEGIRDIDSLRPGESNYTINDHYNQYKELYRLKDIGDIYSEIKSYVDSVSTELQFSKGVMWCRANSSGESINSQISVNGTIRFVIPFGDTEEVYSLTARGSNTDLNLSGLAFPPADALLNTVDINIFYTGPLNLTHYIYESKYNLADAAKLVMTSNMFALINDSVNAKIKLVNKVPVSDSVVYSGTDIISLQVENTMTDRYDDGIFDVIYLEAKDVLNEQISYFINGLLNQYDIELQFTYSNIFSVITPAIGNNFDYNGTRYSVVSVGRKSENIFDIRAIKNGVSTFKFSNDGTTLFDAELSNDGTTMIEWNIRTV